MPTATTLNIVLNGKSVSTPVVDNTEPLLYVLRNQLGQIGPKFGCGVAQCGACTVLVNGAVTRSCVVAVSTIASGATVQTLDGLAQPDASSASNWHPLQRAFVAEQAAQCGFCMNGIVMGCMAWLNKRIANGNRAVPTDTEVQQFLAGKSAESAFVYLCRCGAHTRVVRAVQRAAQEMVA